MTFKLTQRGGFHESTTTSVEVAFYLDAVQDPVLRRGRQGAVLLCRGRANEAREEPMVMRVTTNKTFGAVAAGTFSITLAIPDAYGRSLPPFEDLIVDDTWCDITFIVGKHRFHTLRGMTSSCFVDETTSGEATTRRATIEGFDFGKVFDRTPIWFNQFRAEDAYSEALRIFEVPNVAGTPDEAVRRTLYGFLDAQVRTGRAGNWELPGNMPGWQGTFPDTFVFDATGFNANDQKRIAVSQQFMSPEGQSAWALASEWSDPPFCELYCDLIAKGTPRISSDDATQALTVQGRRSGGLLNPDNHYDVEDTMMGVIFRDRPFVRADLGSQSAWYSLPTVEVIPQELSARNLGRSGQERFNAYFVSPRALQSAGVLQSLVGPLWDPDDIQRHGLRQFSVDSRYLAEQADLFSLTESLRKRARDFHCLNPYFFTGSLNFARWRPDIRIGQRMRIRESTPEQDLWLYVEGVTQQWSGNGVGGRTTVNVTRGWRGTNESLLGAVIDAGSRYEYLPGNNGDPVRDGNPEVSFAGFARSGRVVAP